MAVRVSLANQRGGLLQRYRLGLRDPGIYHLERMAESLCECEACRKGREWEKLMEQIKLEPWKVAQVVEFSRPELADGIDLGSYLDQASGNLRDAEVKERAKLLTLLGRAHVAEVAGIKDEAMTESLVFLNAAEGSGLMTRADFCKFWFSDATEAV